MFIKCKLPADNLYQLRLTLFIHVVFESFYDWERQPPQKMPTGGQGRTMAHELKATTHVTAVTRAK